MSKKPDVKTLLSKKKKAPAVPSSKDPDKCPKCGSGLVQTRTTRKLVCKSYTCDFVHSLD